MDFRQVIQNYDDGQNIFRRPSVKPLIDELERANRAYKDAAELARDRWELLKQLKARNAELETQLVPLQQQFEDWAEQSRRAEADNARLLEALEAVKDQRMGLFNALVDLIMAADASWERDNLGHDWPEACKQAREMVQHIKEITRKQP